MRHFFIAACFMMALAGTAQAQEFKQNNSYDASGNSAYYGGNDSFNNGTLIPAAPSSGIQQRSATNSSTVGVSVDNSAGTIVRSPSGQRPGAIPPVSLWSAENCANGTPGETLGSVTPRRLTSGTVNYASWADNYTGDLTRWLDIASSQNIASQFMGMISGPPLVFGVPKGCYISFAFTPTEEGSLQLYSNTTYGVDDLISLSLAPGQFTPNNPQVICSQLSGSGTNNVFMSTSSGSLCPLKVGTTYYINFTGSDYQGNQICFRGAPNTCDISQISYTIITSRRK